MEQTGAQAIVDIVVVVGDVVGDGGCLRLAAGESGKLQIMAADIFGDVAGHELGSQRPVMFDNALQGFPGKIEAVEFRIAAFQPGDDRQGLRVVIEAAEIAHRLGQRIFAGMAERRVAEVMGKGQGFRQIFVKAQ